MAQNIAEQQRLYYERYKAEAASLGIPIISKAEFDTYVGVGKDPNFQQEYSSFIQNQKEKISGETSTAKANLVTTIQNYINNGNIEAAQQAINDFKTKYPNEDITPYQSYLPVEGSTPQLPEAPTLDTTLPEYTSVIDTPEAPVYQYEPSDLMNSIEAQLTNIMNNPESISPESVRQWTDWLNTTNAEANRMADTRVNEQFSALGDLGSSQNRSALAQANVGRQLGYTQQALGLAQNDLANRYSQRMGGIGGLLNVESANQGQRNIGVNQQWQDYLSRLGNAQNINNTAFTAGINTRTAQNNVAIQNWLNNVNQVQGNQTAGRNQVNANMSGLLGNYVSNANLSNQNVYENTQAQNILNSYRQPNQAEWWQPLLSSFLGSAGQGIGSNFANKIS